MIAVDILEVPLSVNNNRYLLVVQDYYTKWAEAIPLPDQTAARITGELIKIFSTFGHPEILHSDQGRNFESSLLTQTLEAFGVQKSRTPAYHPQGDGMVECFNRSLLQLLRAYVDRVNGNLTKIATVREDVHIAVGSQPKGRLKQVRKQKKSQMAHKETPHIRSSDVVGEETTTHITLPLNAATADKVHVDTRLELQKHRGPTSTDDSHAKRIGQKIIKKTRKSTDPQAQASVNHNSKDLGYLMEKADVDAGFRLPKGSATSDRRNSLQTIYSNDEMSSSDSRMIPSSAKTSTTGLLSGRPSTARRIEHSIFMPPTGSSPRPNSTKFGDAELYSGLGTKFTRGTSAAYQKLPLAPVQKCLVEIPAKEQFMVGKTTVLPPITEANIGGDNSCLPISTSQAPCQKMETDSGLEVSTEEEYSDDEELLPIAELKPISALSFTSAYAYSFFSMAAHHRKVYNITRKKALEPVRLGRSRLLRKKN